MRTVFQATHQTRFDEAIARLANLGGQDGQVVDQGNAVRVLEDPIHDRVLDGGWRDVAFGRQQAKEALRPEWLPMPVLCVQQAVRKEQNSIP